MILKDNMSSDSKVFAALSQSRAEMVTASNRQARYWSAKWYHYQLSQQPVCESKSILAWNVWTQSLFTKIAEYEEVPWPVSDLHSQGIWQSLIKTSEYQNDLISTKATAKLAQAAFSLLQQYRIKLLPSALNSEDHRAFYDWQNTYTAKLKHKNWLDSNALNNWLSDFFEQCNDLSTWFKSTHIYLIGFHSVEPDKLRLIEVLRQKGMDIQYIEPNVHDIAADKSSAFQSITAKVFNSTEDELKSIADWCGEILTRDHKASIGVLIPDLQNNLALVERTFTEILHPELLDQASASSKLFNISLGTPLLEFPLARACNYLIRLMAGRLSSEDVADLIQSQTLGILKSKQGQLLNAVYHLAEQSSREFSLKSLVFWIKSIQADQAQSKESDINHHLDKLLIEATDFKNQRSVRQWIAVVEKWLNLWGWGGHQTQSSRDFQLQAQILEHLNNLKALQVEYSSCSLDEVAQWFHQSLSDASFQAKSLGEPISIMGVYESLALEFDYVWLAGLTMDGFPQIPKRNPFIPYHVAKQYELPGASPLKELKYAESLKQNLKALSENMTISFSSQQDGTATLPSAYWSEFVFQPQTIRCEQDLPEPPLEELTDQQGFALMPEHYKGGTSFFATQSACPFNAYMQFRLGLYEQETPSIGVDPLQRGLSIHKALQLFWQRVKNHEQLARLGEFELKDVIHSCVQQSVAETFKQVGLIEQVEMEYQCLVIRTFLQSDIERDSFVVDKTEQSVEFEFAGLKLKGIVDRVDLIGEQRLIIDYKTSHLSVPKWLNQRIPLPQLPIYAQALTEVDAIAFAKVRHEKQGYVGIGQLNEFVKGIIPIEKWSGGECDWSSFLNHTQDSLNVIANEIKSGCASVTPDIEQNPCLYCELHSVCRINESPLQIKADYELIEDQA